jgi:bifunctional non-homologous end joining protein LigD
VPRRSRKGSIHYILINDLATLIWCVNLASLELHPFLHRVPHIDRPTYVVFDLDPGEGMDVLDCARVAFLLKEALERAGLVSFAKVSGSKGLQIYTPLNTPVTYAVTQPFARGLAEQLEREHPELVVSEMAKAARKGKVFIDWSQNAEHKTTVAVYSLRAKSDRPYCSMPVTWEELRRAAEAEDTARLYFEPAAALARLEKTGDLFAPVLTVKQELPGAPKAPVSQRKQRAPAKTAEPRASRQGSRRRFVVEKNALRLEMHGVLKSWALPKGLPRRPEEKLPAIAIEDQPLEYGPASGTYGLIEGGYSRGRLDVFLNGAKLKGEWVLERREGNQWTVSRTGERR